MPVIPSKNEDEHVWKEELKQRMQKLEQQQRATAEAEKLRLKDLHWMHCPKCGQNLLVEKYGRVEIDACPNCKGLWLDANELEMILADAPKRNLLGSWLKILGE